MIIMYLNIRHRTEMSSSGRTAFMLGTPKCSQERSYICLHVQLILVVNLLYTKLAKIYKIIKSLFQQLGCVFILIIMDFNLLKHD